MALVFLEGAWTCHRQYPDHYPTRYWAEFPNVIFCNGIAIPEYDFSQNVLQPPIISIFDLDARLPINLNRTVVNFPIGLEKKIKKDIYKDFIAKMLLTEVQNVFYNNRIELIQTSIVHPSINKKRIPISDLIEFEVRDFSVLVYGKTDFVLNHPIFTNQLLGFNYLRIFRFSKVLEMDEDPSFIEEPYCVKSSGVDFVSMVVPAVSSGYKEELYSEINEYYSRNTGKNVIGWTKDFQDFKWNTEEEIDTKWYLEEEFKSEESNLENLIFIFHTISMEYYVPSLFSDIISELFGDDLLIPYNIEDRKK